MVEAEVKRCEEDDIFSTYVLAANSKGAGYIQIPETLTLNITVGDYVFVKFQDCKASFYGKICDWRGPGVYVPASLSKSFGLWKTDRRVRIQKLGGFHTTVGADGRMYIPTKKAKEKELDETCILRVNAKINGESRTVYSRVNIRERVGKKKEYRILFDNDYAGEDGVFRIEKIFRPGDSDRIVTEDGQQLLTEFQWCVDNDQVHVFSGNYVPVAMSPNINLDEYGYYLGAFFADGTKKGNSWGITASTPEQAVFYKQNHTQIIQDADLSTELTYTRRPEDTTKQDTLRAYWERDTDIAIDRIQEFKTEATEATNRNPYGALYFREHRGIVRDLYNTMLDTIIKRIIEERRKWLAWDFLLGVAAGDGAAAARKRGHIHIATNTEDVKTLHQLFQVAEIRGKPIEERSGCVINIGSLDLLTHLEYVGDKLFQYYPKRRRRSIQRLLDTGGARFLLNGKETAGWVKAYFQEFGIVDGGYTLTEKGRKIQQCLKEFRKEVS